MVRLKAHPSSPDTDFAGGSSTAAGLHECLNAYASATGYRLRPGSADVSDQPIDSLDPRPCEAAPCLMRSLALALVAATTLTALAQTPRPKNALLEETTIRSGTGGQFDAAQHDYCTAVVKGGAPACLVFSTATFGQSDFYFTLLPFASFIHYDQGKYTDKGLTPEEAKALSARRVPPIASNHESAIALQTEISILPTVSNPDFPINHFTEYRLRPGTQSDFLNSVRKILLPAARKAGFLEFEVFTTTVGESPDRILIASRLKNFAALDAGDPIRAALTQIGNSMFDDVLKADVLSTKTYLMRYRADISVDPHSPVK